MHRLSCLRSATSSGFLVTLSTHLPSLPLLSLSLSPLPSPTCLFGEVLHLPLPQANVAVSALNAVSSGTLTSLMTRSTLATTPLSTGTLTSAQIARTNPCACPVLTSFATSRTLPTTLISGTRLMLLAVLSPHRTSTPATTAGLSTEGQLPRPKRVFVSTAALPPATSHGPWVTPASGRTLPWLCTDARTEQSPDTSDL